MDVVALSAAPTPCQQLRLSTQLKYKSENHPQPDITSYQTENDTPTSTEFLIFITKLTTLEASIKIRTTFKLLRLPL